MGGRGSKSASAGRSLPGGAAAMTVDVGDGFTTTYFKRGGKVYRSDALALSNPSPVEARGGIRDVYDGVKSRGYDVRLHTKTEVAEAQSARAAERKAVSDDLDRLWFAAGPRPRKGMKGH